jgi:TPR repeat protein
MHIPLFLINLSHGHRPEIPPETLSWVTQLMKNCWGPAENDRPPFTLIAHLLYHQVDPPLELNAEEIVEYQEYQHDIYRETYFKDKTEEWKWSSSDPIRFTEERVKPDSGNPQSAYRIGKILPRNRNHTLAFQYFLAASKKGHYRGIIETANAYGKGRGTQIDQRKAFELVNGIACDSRLSVGQLYDLKLRLARLLGCHHQVLSILEPLTTVENGEIAIKAKYLIGRYYRQRRENEKALDWLRPLAESGHPLSLNDVARIEFELGNTSQETWNKFIKAGELKVPAALMNIAIFYDPEEKEVFPEIEKNEERALFYYNRAADLRYPLAQIRIARHQIKIAEKMDPMIKIQFQTDALWRLKSTAEAGDKVAQLIYGEHCVKGDLGSLNVGEGLKYLLLAAEQGSIRAMRLMADVLKNPKSGVQLSLDRAQKLEQRAKTLEDLRKSRAARQSV